MLNFIETSIEMLVVLALLISFFVILIKRATNFLYKKTSLGLYIPKKFIKLLVLLTVGLTIFLLIKAIPNEIHEALMSI